MRGFIRASLPVLLLIPGLLAAQRFLPDDPLQRDRDDTDIPCPGVIELSPTHDALTAIWRDPGRGQDRATNVNTLGEVPDSTWFTNRIGRRLWGSPPGDAGGFSLDEILLGGDVRGGPGLTGPIRVVGAGLGALTDSLVIEDDRGDRYFIKFDPSAHPNLGTAADLITSRFLYVAGYPVLPTCLVRLDPGRFEIREGARVRLMGGGEVPLTDQFVASILTGAARDEDGAVRVSAARLPSGTPVGRFRFHGTRGDDANDIFRHENRRELRGLRVFAAWLNHTHVNSPNTLDVWETEHGRSFLRHYLVDFTSSLGSGFDLNRKIVPKDPRSGYEHSLGTDTRTTLKSALSLGLWRRPWLRVRYPYLPEIGNIEAEFFDPKLWKPDYPNPAFGRLQPEDALWAIGILSLFDDDSIRAVVGTGQFRDPAAADYLSKVLIRRRDKLIRHHLEAIPPLVGFSASDGHLEFRDLAPEWIDGLKTAYAFSWFEFDNLTGATKPVHSLRYTGLPRIPVPESAAEFVMVRIEARREDRSGSEKPVEVYLRREPALAIVGIDR